MTRATQIEPEWLDGRFLQRLWQRGQQPGVVQQQQASTIQARLTQMSLGQPLAAAIQQRWTNTVATDAAAVPIVFVHPPQAGPVEPVTDHQAIPINVPRLPIVQTSTPGVGSMPMATGVIQRAAILESTRDEEARQQPQVLLVVKKVGVLAPSPLTRNRGLISSVKDVSAALIMSKLPEMTAVAQPTIPPQPAIAPPVRKELSPISPTQKQVDEKSIGPSLLPKETLPLATEGRPLPIVRPQAVVNAQSGRSNQAHSQPLPLVRPAITSPTPGVIQRSPVSSTTSGMPVGNGRSAVAPPISTNTAVIQRTVSNNPTGQPSSPDTAQITVQVQRQWLRHLQIEAERRGIRT